MYHPTVSRKMLDLAVDALQVNYPGLASSPPTSPYSLPYRLASIAHLDSLYNPESGELSRSFTPDEQKFILFERLFCKFDFHYWLEAYGYCYADDIHGQIQKITLWDSQQLFLDAFAEAQFEMWERYEAGETSFDGLCFLVHKARQLGFTMVAQFLAVHLMNFYSAIRGLTASVNDEKTQAIYLDRFKIAYYAQPLWLRQDILEDVKDRGMKLGNKSRMALQDATQKAGLAQGSQVDYSHLTECASWPDPATQIQNHFFPTIPQSMRAICILESTAQGVSLGGPIWWKRAVELALARRMSRFRCVFVPWYAEAKKYRAYPPPGWSPTDATLRHAKLVEQTSHAYVHRTVHLSREQLYWYEREYEAARISGTLNLFLANYCATVEESFQHAGSSAFSHEVVEIQQAGTLDPVPFEILTADLPQGRIWNSSAPGAPRALRAGRETLVPVTLSPDDPIDDPRGLVLLWEPPIKTDRYFIGVDTATGIPNWRRLFTREEDSLQDNAIISIWRHTPTLDLQVAEYAAPVAESELSRLIWMLGRIYAGADESGEAPVIIEVVPKGLACQQRLANEFGYSNLYEWVSMRDGVTATPSGTFGWQSNQRSMQALWAHGRYHINSGRIRARSKWLVNEMRTCVDDPIRARAAALSGFHDDRVIAALLALWFANGWDMYSLPDAGDTIVYTPPPLHVPGTDKGRGWQESAVGANELGDLWDEMYMRVNDLNDTDY